MIKNNVDLSSIWFDTANNALKVIDQRYLPFDIKIFTINSVDSICLSINEMIVRGAPLIGVTAGYGVYFCLLESKNNKEFESNIEKIRKTRPTAINLNYAINFVLNNINQITDKQVKLSQCLSCANELRELEINNCYQIGVNGLEIIETISNNKKGENVNILTHCNAGWLACVKYGTATAPIYLAHKKGIKIHVWVDETRPRNQGARLTTWELEQAGINYTLIADNTGGHLMQNKMVDMVIVGSDRTTANGDVANKIGTYLKALAAYDNNIPFYVALPLSTFDLNIKYGCDIPIEKRSEDEVKYIDGYLSGKLERVLITTEKAMAINYGFDVTPAKYITGLITEKGIICANKNDIKNIFTNE